MTFQLRAYRAGDSAIVDQIAIAAFSEFNENDGEWPTRERTPQRASSLATAGEMIVASMQDDIAGCVTYVSPGLEKQEWFDREWAVIRMLAVRPECRGLGVGKALTEECVRRARRDGAAIIALHTSRLLHVAVAMYERMGFSFLRESNTHGGVSYGIWVKPL